MKKCGPVFKKDAPDFAKEIDASLTHMVHLVTKKEDAIPWIERVRQKGCHTYVLSNFSKTAYVDCQDALDFQQYMDGCFWSYQHHVIKPDLACYLTMLYTFHIKPENSVFIDDTKANLLAAEQLGIHTILYQNQVQAEKDLDTLLAL